MSNKTCTSCCSTSFSLNAIASRIRLVGPIVTQKDLPLKPGVYVTTTSTTTINVTSTTSTSTTSPIFTTTSTTTSACKTCSPAKLYIQFSTFAGVSVTSVLVDGVPVTLVGGVPFPISINSQTANITPGLHTITVTVNSSIGLPLVTDRVVSLMNAEKTPPSCSYSDCYKLNAGVYTYTFTNVYVNCETILNIGELAPGNICKTVPLVITTTSTSTSSTTTSTSTSTSTTTSTTTIPSTTTSTTTALVVPACGVFISSNPAPIVSYYNPATNTAIPLNVPGATNFQDIANTSTKLWLSNGLTNLQEYIVQFSPFSATFNRTLTTPHLIGTGLTAVDSITLLAVNSALTPRKFVKLDVSGLTPVSIPLYDMIAGREVKGDLIVTTGGKLIVTNYDPSSPTVNYLTQYNYLTGAVEIDIVLPPAITTPAGLFEYNNQLYIINNTFTNSEIYLVSNTSPYGVILQGVIPYITYGASQTSACNLISLTPTSTSTSTSTTTSTTTSP